MFYTRIGCSNQDRVFLNQDKVFKIRIDVLNQDRVFYTRIGCSKSVLLLKVAALVLIIIH